MDVTRLRQEMTPDLADGGRARRVLWDGARLVRDVGTAKIGQGSVVVPCLAWSRVGASLGVVFRGAVGLALQLRLRQA